MRTLLFYEGVQQPGAEASAGYRGDSENLALLLGQQIDARQHRRMHRIWQASLPGPLFRASQFGKASDEFKGEEGIASRPLHQVLTYAFRQFERYVADQFVCLGLAQRLQGQCGEVLPASSPPGTPIQQFGPTEGEQQQGGMGAQVHDMLHQVQQTLAGPVQILKDNDVWGLLRQGFDQQAPARKQALAVDAPFSRAVSHDAQSSENLLREMHCILCLVANLREDGAQTHMIGFAAEQVTQEAPQWPVGEALAVGQAAREGHLKALFGSKAPQKLFHQTCFAGACRGNDGDQLRALLLQGACL